MHIPRGRSSASVTWIRNVGFAAVIRSATLASMIALSLTAALTTTQPGVWAVSAAPGQRLQIAVSPPKLAPWSYADASVRFAAGQVLLTMNGVTRTVAHDDAKRLDPAFAALAAVSPDRHWLLYVSARNEGWQDASLNVVNLSTLHRHVLATFSTQFWPELRWAPDSQYIAYVRMNTQSGRPEVFVTTVSGLATRKVISANTFTTASLSGYSQATFGWRNDGQALIYYDNALTPHVAYTVAVSTGAQIAKQLITPLAITGPTTPTTSCNAPIFTQWDSRWGNDIMQTAGQTITNDGCLLTSATMLADYYGASQEDPGAMNSCLGGGADPLTWSDVPPCAVNTNFIQLNTGFSWATLNSQLAQGFPVILGVTWNTGGTHWVLVVAGDNSDNPANYLINDPEYATRQTLVSLANNSQFTWTAIYQPISGHWSPCVTGGGSGPSQRVGELDANGNLLVADGPVGTPFTQAIGPNIKAAAFSNTNLTGVIDGNGNFLVDSGSLNNFSAVLGPGVNNGPIITAIALSGNVQGALDNSGNLWIANGVGSAFTKVIGPNIQDFALSGTRIGVIDGNGNFLVEDTSQSSSFTAVLGPGVNAGPFIKAVALSGTRMGALDSAGNFWAADGPVGTAFTKVIGPGIQAITMTDCQAGSTTYDRLGVIDGNGNFLANEGALNASFGLQRNPLVTRIGLYCSRVGALDTNGNGFLKDGSLSGSWTQEVAGKQAMILPEASSAIHAMSMRLGALDGSGNLWVADGPLGKSFTKVIGPNIKAAALSGTRIGVIDGNGNFLVADGPVGTSFTVVIGPSLHSGPVITAIALSGTRLGAVDASGNVWAADGPIGASPSIVQGPALGGPTFKSVGLSGSRIGALDTSGNLWVADGAVGAAFTKVIGPNIQSFILSGQRIGVIDGNGNFLVNQGAVTASFALSLGPNIQAIAMTSCQSGPTFNWGVSYNRLGVIDGNGNFLIDDNAVTGSLTSYSLEQQKVVAQIGLYCSRIAMLNPSGNFYAHDGDDTPSWTLEMAGVKALVLPDAS